MKFIKKVFGFESSYSWVKWLRISFAVLGLVIVAMPAILFDDYTVGGLIMTLILGIPAILLGIGIAALIGLLIGGNISAKKQKQSREEINASGNERLQDLDKSRAAAQGGTLAAGIAEKIFVGVSVVLALLVIFGAMQWWVAVIIGLVLAVIAEGIAIPARKHAAQFKSDFSEAAVRPLLEASGLQNVMYQPLRSVEKSAAEESGLFAAFGRMSGSEYVSAVYYGESFRLSNITLQNEHKSVDGNGDLHTVWTNIAEGTLFVFEGAADIQNPVLFFDKKLRKKDGIAAGNEEIDTRFTVFADEAALMQLSSAALSGVAAAAAEIKEPVSVSITHGKLYFMVHDRKIFAAAVESDQTLMEQRRRIEADIELIKSVAKGLSTVLKY